MAVRPIIFSGPMVRALLDGRKTQTRRVLKPQPRGIEVFEDGPGNWISHGYGEAGDDSAVVPYAPGDVLWVRETWGAWPHMNGGVQRDSLRYRADGEYQNEHGAWRWRPSIHMPRWASRLTLIVTDVRVERLQDISEADARAEGVAPAGAGFCFSASGKRSPIRLYRTGFVYLWNTLNAKRGFGWDVNPWVAVVTFTVEKRNVDA